MFTLLRSLELKTQFVGEEQSTDLDLFHNLGSVHIQRGVEMTMHQTSHNDASKLRPLVVLQEIMFRLRFDCTQRHG